MSNIRSLFQPGTISFLPLLAGLTLLASLLFSPLSDAKEAKAIFAGGCFWCMEPPFDELDGVISTTSGYTDGHKKNPTYREVSAGITGHTEAVEVVYDPDIVSYQTLLDVFWVNIDPFALGLLQQFRKNEVAVWLVTADHQKRLLLLTGNHTGELREHHRSTLGVFRRNSRLCLFGFTNSFAS